MLERSTSARNMRARSKSVCSKSVCSSSPSNIGAHKMTATDKNTRNSIRNNSSSRRNRSNHYKRKRRDSAIPNQTNRSSHDDGEKDNARLLGILLPSCRMRHSPTRSSIWQRTVTTISNIACFASFLYFSTGIYFRHPLSIEPKT